MGTWGIVTWVLKCAQLSSPLIRIFLFFGKLVEHLVMNLELRIRSPSLQTVGVSLASFFLDPHTLCQALLVFQPPP